MKTKLTNKMVKELYPNIKSASYCQIQTLLRGVEPIAYTSGKYGWNYDVYNIYGVTIATGYRNIPGERITAGTEYEEKAQKIWANYDISWDERQRQTTELLKEFCKINGGTTKWF